jgi:ANTAR domain
VAETGARGMFVFPLHVGAAKIGVLDCYRDTPGPLSDHDLSGALRAADAAVWALLDGLDPRTIGDGDPNGSDTDEWVDGSALARAEVHQATGMLIAQSGLDAPAALARLRAVAFSTGRRINDIANDVLARRLRLHPDGAWHTTGTGHTTSEHDTSGPIEPTDRDEENPR